MKRLKLGVRLESFGLPLRRALLEAQRLEVTGVQFDAVADLSPVALTQTGRRELKHLLRSHNVELTALGCPLRRGLDATEDQQQRLEHVRAVLDLSFDLGPRTVVVQAGRIPTGDEVDSTRGRALRDSLLALSTHGDRTGTVLALETGLEPGSVLADYLKQYESAGLGANLDPANLLLNRFDPIASTRDLRGLIKHVHARDARASGASRAVQEVPLGHGDIEWLEFLALLEEVEYHGWLTVERETGENRLADLTAGVSFLRRFVSAD